MITVAFIPIPVDASRSRCASSFFEAAPFGRLPKTYVSFKIVNATIKLTPRLATIPMLMARPRMSNGWMAATK